MLLPVRALSSRVFSGTVVCICFAVLGNAEAAAGDVIKDVEKSIGKGVHDESETRLKRARTTLEK